MIQKIRNFRIRRRSSKNTAQQTGPLLDQILRRNDGGQEYIIQITDARPDTGGLSGATLQEGKSWGQNQELS
jgi:homospermidine synthase (spermidine-specific) (EC 2.5.1.45)